MYIYKKTIQNIFLKSTEFTEKRVKVADIILATKGYECEIWKIQSESFKIPKGFFVGF